MSQLPSVEHSVTRVPFDFKLDPARCAIVGDQMSDVEAGAAARAWFADSCRIPALPKRGAAIPTP